MPLDRPTTHPERCQAPRLGYIAASVDAERRMKRGETQHYCATCERYQWKDNQCPQFVRD
jgi:hypothetical protein